MYFEFTKRQLSQHLMIERSSWFKLLVELFLNHGQTAREAQCTDRIGIPQSVNEIVASPKWE
ncbi:hypothetical protein [Bradyrhizobium sp. SK17]|uniref:hypothetical protein n=1 Tax=Bradyrhizobium sp. SK17 TaxID=2057741 RepID=UPI0012FE30CC|nr:hypothetical protein [Bradyrhizobium sp. SK17]